MDSEEGKKKSTDYTKTKRRGSEKARFWQTGNHNMSEKRKKKRGECC